MIYKQKHPLYKLWLRIKKRSIDSYNSGFKGYRAPIPICSDWYHSFDSFVADIPPKPGNYWRLCLVTPRLGYVQGNVYWKKPKRLSTPAEDLHHIQKLPSGKFRVRVYDESGKRISSTAMSLKEALIVRDQMLSETSCVSKQIIKQGMHYIEKVSPNSYRVRITMPNGKRISSTAMSLKEALIVRDQMLSETSFVSHKIIKKGMHHIEKVSPNTYRVRMTMPNGKRICSESMSLKNALIQRDAWLLERQQL